MQCAERLRAHAHRIVGVVSTDRTVQKWAEAQGIFHAGQSLALTSIAERGPFDYLFSIANFEILGPDVLRTPRQMAINFHDGPLPAYRGLHAPSWALLHGERRHGVTWHVMTDQIDAGDILEQEPVDISERDTSFTLNAKCFEAGLASFARLVDSLGRGDVRRVQQQPGGRLFTRDARPSGTCVLSFAKPARDVERAVRAYEWGPYANPFGLARLWVGRNALIVTSVRVDDDSRTTQAPGTVTGVSSSAVTVAALDRSVRLEAFTTPTGESIRPVDAAHRLGLSVGVTIPEPPEGVRDRLERALRQAVCQERFWVDRLASLRPFELPAAVRPRRAQDEIRRIAVDLPREYLALGARLDRSPARLIEIAVLTYLARVGAGASFDVGFSASQLRSSADLPALLADAVPCRVVNEPDQPFTAMAEQLGVELDLVSGRFTYALDVLLRYPALKHLRDGGHGLPVVIAEVHELAQADNAPSAQLTISVDREGTGCIWSFNERTLDGMTAGALAGQFTEFCRAIAARPDARLLDLPLLCDAEHERVTRSWNPTALPELEAAGVHELIERQAVSRPAATAVVADDGTMTFAELDARARTLAAALRASGVGPGARVAVCLPRRSTLIVTLLAVWKAGGTYVPIDLLNPRERLAFVLEDSGAALLVTESSLADRLPPFEGRTLLVDVAATATGYPEDAAVEPSPDRLAYVIYTSGSTGWPKGVMVSHANVLSFFAGMDRHLGTDDRGVWLAVTSVSFDISILELWWTLARGYTVVIHGEERPVTLSAARSPKPVSFSLAYFSSDSGRNDRGRYRLLLEGARFADQHGFEAVWTPERHFHAFGGLYPNPALTSAAVAAVTERIHVRAGSVVLPLHDPVRVAEEWAVVDNLSDGRVGVSFASGWQQNDFILAPERYADRRDVLLRDLRVVQRLWRGEAVTRSGPGGRTIDVRTLPRPIQRELPVWITAAGNPETFRLAGELGANLLTHLLGQDLETLSSRLDVYRQAWRDAGHAGDGHVTLMLHTYLGANVDDVKAQVRGPLSDYLRSSVDLLKAAPASFPAWSASGKDGVTFEDLPAQDLDALVDHAFDRYYETSGLFGTSQTALAMVHRLRDLGINEIACLIDFGLSDQAVLGGLEHLVELKRMADRSGRDRSLAEEILADGVSHLQCTPSLAAALMNDAPARSAVGHLRTLLVGGEPLTPELADELRRVVGGRVLNMYGPTETTVWSTADPVSDGASVTLGRPLANTRLYVVNERMEAVAAGVPGEIVIGGQGVAVGYWNQSGLTKKRFVPDPFDARNGLVYRTGDIGRFLDDGRIEFLGRADRQIKIRGHRVEPEEIERTLASHGNVREAAVVARQGAAPGDTRLFAYVVPAGALDVHQLRAFAESRLPDYMVPASFTLLENLPKTAGGKIDRTALPVSGGEEPPGRGSTPPEGPIEEVLHAIWLDLLQVPVIDVEDDFFSLGGHSLLAIQLVSRIRETFKTDLPLRTLFEERSIRRLARALQALEPRPGLTETIARLYLRVSRLSDDEVVAALQNAMGGSRPLAGGTGTATLGVPA